jgi:nitrate/nitrite transport system ATP-binding protein
MPISFLDIDHIDKVFPLKGGGEYVALKGINLEIRSGEFISLIGHSGCGKSTLLNIIAGFDQASSGGVVLEGKQITEPGPDRMVVFQNYSLLPWLTVRENIALAVNRVLRHLPAAERQAIIDNNIKLVGLSHAADRKPKALSGGMKQRTAIARALSLRPKVMLLDEPFGALDALTRGNLQEQLMAICQETGMTCVMVTHDVDEALLLSDRVIMLTNGPEARIGRVLDVAIPRPRKRLEAVKHPDYYHYRSEIISFLNQQKRAKRRQGRRAEERVLSIPAVAAVRPLERTTLTLGYVPTTNAAPLIVAQEKGFFQKYGITDVTLVAERSWSEIANGTAQGRFDAAQMLAGMPLAMIMGAAGYPQTKIINPMVLARNGNAVTLHERYFDQGVRSLADLKQAIAQPDSPGIAQATGDRDPGRPKFGIIDPISMGSLLLRYWLASGGIDPDQDITLSVMNSNTMGDALALGNLDGYFAAAPWSHKPIQEGKGFVVATDLEFWEDHMSQVLGMREDWAQANPETAIALVKALIEACRYCDTPDNREEVAQLLAQEAYLNVPVELIRPGFVTAYDKGTDAAPQMLPHYHRFYLEQATCPRRLEILWIMTQMARWGMSPFPKNWIEVVNDVYNLEIYGKAARALGLPDQAEDRKPVQLFDGISFNPDDPVAYLKGLEIRQNIRIAEIPLETQLVPAV